MDSKECSVCGVNKIFSEFSKDKSRTNGITSRCKMCTNDYFTRWHKSNPNKFRSIQKRYYENNKNDINARARERGPAAREKYKDKIRAKREASRDSLNKHKREMRKNNPEWRLKEAEYQRNYHKINKKKVLARQAVSDAIKKGSMVRFPCCVCGNPKSEGHHEDYAKPLDVTWLCRKHHAEHHAL